jgi:hypothetical protein
MREANGRNTPLTGDDRLVKLEAYPPLGSFLDPLRRVFFDTPSRPLPTRSQKPGTFMSENSLARIALGSSEQTIPVYKSGLCGDKAASDGVLR